jgi:hypothetical protein
MALADVIQILHYKNRPLTRCGTTVWVKIPVYCGSSQLIDENTALVMQI